MADVDRLAAPRDSASMGISFRIYIFADDGSLRRVPRRICERLPLGEDAIPEFANSKQKVCQVLLENEDGRPLQILDATGHFWTFDEEGQIDRTLREGIAEIMNANFRIPKPSKGRVVDLVPEIKRKEIRERHRWTLTNEELDLIAADIWPGIHGAAPDITVVQGKAPKRPALSYEAKDAIREIERHVREIEWRLQVLTEHSLKGLEFEARRTATTESPALWEAVAVQAKSQRDIRAAYRTGKGEWIAIVEAFHATDPVTERSAAREEVRCANQKEAIETAHRLAAEKAHWVGPDVRVEVSICSALDLDPEREHASLHPTLAPTRP